ncbi:MAG: tetratricopeptide repeat protein [Bacteroidota bacterium]
MKAAMAYEELGNFEKALGIYKKIKEEFPRSYEGRDIDKYISYTEGLIKK